MIAVLFEAGAQPETQERYLQLASELKALLFSKVGFVSIAHFQILAILGKIPFCHGGKMRSLPPDGSKM